MDTNLIAGIGLTHLAVYDQRPAPDGKQSGCAHVHAVTDEAYFVISGTGALELHDVERGFRNVPLAAGSFVQFAPGTLHRAVNTGGLTCLCIMGNAGLAERGDARIYFGPEADADAELYQQYWRLPAENGLDGALERRDRSIAAYMDLMRLWDTDRDAYRARLQSFVDRHLDAVAPLRERFQDVLTQGPGLSLNTVLARLGDMPRAADGAAATAVGHAPGAPRLGMCGLLRPLDVPTPV
jgi:hypothetical protein